MSEAPEESGIQSSEEFDAFAQSYTAISLFTQFFDDTFGYLREQIAGLVESREPGAALGRLTITGPPVPRGDGHPDYDDPDPANARLVLTRSALYVPFTARVRSPSRGPEALQGALTCVIGNVNQPGNLVARTWMDVDDSGTGRFMTPDSEQYQARMLSVGEWLASDYPPGSPERTVTEP